MECNVVVFSEPSVKKTATIDHVSKTQMKAFMVHRYHNYKDKKLMLKIVVFKNIQNIIEFFGSRLSEAE